MNEEVWKELKTWLLELNVIEDSVEAPQEIKRLDLSGKSLNELNENIGLLDELVSLNLSGNNLQSLPSSMFLMQKLNSLDLRRNQFTKLPTVLVQLQLRSLNLSGNMLDDIGDLAHLPNVRVLDLSVNAITSLDGVFSKSNEIRTLNLSCNYLKDVEDLFLSLPNTERLDLSGNMITQIPATIEQMESLVDLKISNNVIEHIDDTFFSLGIETLDLSSNKLYWLKLHGLEELEHLILDFNPIKHIEVSDDFAPYLEEFSCDGCGLKNCVPLKSEHLHTLCYSSNEIMKIPESIGRLVGLKQLDIEGNKIIDLPDSMANLSELNTLYIEGNPLSESARKVVEVLHPEICDINMITGITIEVATENDLTEMAHLLSLLFAIEQDFEIDYEKQLSGITKLFHHAGKNLLVAKHENRVVGMVTMQRLISSAEGD
ncbi:MAG TPA: leucine-rich repeat domain-containing protein, partial [Epsilonproteobacteria bacterium]|nr:leucine-rich repeat domain-containing protein [Campylobacterota bacterium]